MTAALRDRPGVDRRKNRSRPQLKVLNQQAIRQRARRRNVLLTLFILVLAGFFAVAFLQAQLVADQQGLDLLRARIAEAERDNARLARDVEVASSPAVIVGRAQELGMVRAYQPVYLEASAPIRDIPSAPVFDPETGPAFRLAAPQAASVQNLNPGLSQSVPVAGPDDPVDVAAQPVPTDSPQGAIPAEPSAAQPSAAQPTAAQPSAAQPTTVEVAGPTTGQSSFSGVAIPAQSGTTGPSLAGPASTGPRDAAGQPASAVASLAGTTAVTGGTDSG